MIEENNFIFFLTFDFYYVIIIIKMREKIYKIKKKEKIKHDRLRFLGYKMLAGTRTKEEDIEARLLYNELYPDTPITKDNENE